MTLEVVSDAPTHAGQSRLGPDSGAVSIEEAMLSRTVKNAYPRTGSVVVRYSPRRADRAAVLAAIIAPRTSPPN